MKYILDHLRNSNHRKQDTIDLLTGLNNQAPMLEDIERQDCDAMETQIKRLKKRISDALNQVKLHEIEGERTMNKYKMMLQDKLALTENVEDITRSLGFVGGLSIYQKHLTDSKSKTFDQMYSKAKLEIDQEKVVCNLIISGLQKQEEQAQMERAELVI